MVAFAIFATVPTYHVAPLFLLPVLWAGVYFRRALHLHPFHYALLAGAILLHMSGAFGLYRRSIFNLSFDIYVHFYFAFAAAMPIQRLLRHHLDLGFLGASILTLFVIMGIGALHEIMEYGSYLALGEEKGMLKPTTSYQFDTQRDLLNNLLGCILSLLLQGIARQISVVSRGPRSPAEEEPKEAVPVDAA